MKSDKNKSTKKPKKVSKYKEKIRIPELEGLSFDEALKKISLTKKK